MKKRDMKALRKEVHSFAVGGMQKKEQRALQQKGTVKLPYHMY